MPNLRKPYLLFLGEETRVGYAKTAFGLRDWARDSCIGQWRLPACSLDLDLPELSPEEAAALGAGSLVIGVAPVGGTISDDWVPLLVRAVAAGLDIVSGMHVRLKSLPPLEAAAMAHGIALHDVRHSNSAARVASGRKRSGKRLLTVGTDCALGKKYTALSIAREMRRRGLKATFRATGQTGIMIAGCGVAIDAVVADFLAGAAEALSPDNEPDHWDIVEGQGSLFHPAYAAVTLGFLHGSQPDVLVLCHDPRRTTLLGWPQFPIPDLTHVIDCYLAQGKLTNGDIRCGGISLNTGGMPEEARHRYIVSVAHETGLPVFDPMRDDLGTFLDRLTAV